MSKWLFAGSLAVLVAAAALITSTSRKPAQVYDIDERANLARLVH